MNVSNLVTHVNPHPLAELSQYDGYIIAKYVCNFHVLPAFQTLLSFLPGEEPRGLPQMLGYVKLADSMAEDGRHWAEPLQYILPPLDTLPQIEFDSAYSGLSFDNVKIDGKPYYHLHAQLPSEVRNFFVDFKNLLQQIPSNRTSSRNNVRGVPYISLGWIAYDKVKDLSWFKGQISLDLSLNNYRLSEDPPIVKFKPVGYLYGRGQVG